MKKIKILFCILAMMISLAGCRTSDSKDQHDLKEVTLILDYLPNTNHTGFYVALKNGYYEEEGLNVQIIEPGDDSTSAVLVAANKGEFGVSYQEDVTYGLTAKEPLPIRAIAAIVQHNTSGFVSLTNAHINSPKDFEGKVYAGWQAPSEEAVIQAVMNKANADFSKLTLVGADGSGFASLGNTVDLQWEFEGWAVIKGRMEGYDLNYMPLRDLDERLDYYTPVLITNTDMIENDPETVRKFVNATKKGYEFAIANPEEATEILYEIVPEYDKEFILASQQFLSLQYSLDSTVWGMMKDEVWDNYTSFMVEAGLIDHKIEAKDQYTNQFLK